MKRTLDAVRASSQQLNCFDKILESLRRHESTKKAYQENLTCQVELGAQIARRCLQEGLRQDSVMYNPNTTYKAWAKVRVEVAAHILGDDLRLSTKLSVNFRSSLRANSPQADEL